MQLRRNLYVYRSFIYIIYKKGKSTKFIYLQKSVALQYNIITLKQFYEIKKSLFIAGCNAWKFPGIPVSYKILSNLTDFIYLQRKWVSITQFFIVAVT